MFDIGWGELIVIGVVALIAIGPKELPTVLRTVGQWMGKVRRMASEFQGQFQEAMREAEFAELKKQVDGIGEGANFNPLETARRELETAMEDKPPSTDAAAVATPAPAPDYTAADVASTAPPASDGLAAASMPPAADAPPVPPVAVEPQLPSPEPAPPLSEKDFNPDRPSPPEVQTGGGRAA
jgi:sec-independent protein translocase protein TatB